MKTIQTVLKHQEVLRVFLLFGIIILISTWRVLSFGFWKDDWVSYWGARAFSPVYYQTLFHPGSVVQFTLLSFLLPANSIIWQIIGVVWKLFAAYGVYRMVGRLSASKTQALIAGAIFAGSQFGLDAAGWPSATIVLINVFFLTYTTVAWHEYLSDSEKKVRRVPILLTLVTVGIDPFRTLPILFFILLLFLRYSRKGVLVFLGRLKAYYWTIPILLFICFFWGIPWVQETVVYKYFAQVGFNLSTILSKTYLIGNYFSSLFNIIIGIFVVTVESLSTGVHNPVGARLTIVLVGILSVWVIHLHRKKDERAWYLLFLLAWMIIFYVPNFLSEPRLTMGATHRYTTIPSVGWVGIVALFLSFIKPKTILLVVSTLIVCISMVVTSSRAEEWNTFRSRAFLSRIWSTVNETVPRDGDISILLFTGDHPIVSNVLHYSSSSPFVVVRNQQDEQEFPILINSLSEGITYVCHDTTRVLSGKPSVMIPSLPLLALHSWNIALDGSMTNTSIINRTDLQKLMEEDPDCI